eukprot:4138583-Heterocapsa_arctica.AAC.1
MRPAGKRRKRDWEPETPGVLDLFSGSRCFARAALRRGAPWVLCYAWEQDPVRQDLFYVSVRVEIEALIRSGALTVIGAGPICASFSRAVTPCVRDRTHPRGVPWATDNTKRKMRDGNSNSDWKAV